VITDVHDHARQGTIFSKQFAIFTTYYEMYGDTSKYIVDFKDGRLETSTTFFLLHESENKPQVCGYKII
jgi:hypothetical protein